jgi:predicted nucleic acid-binding Zn ribbon protein
MPSKRLSKTDAKLRAARRQVLAEWRGLEEPETFRHREHLLADVLSRVLKKADLENKCDIEDIIAGWPAAVGAFIAGQSKPETITDGVLIIQVLHPSVRFELERNHKRKILTSVQKQFPLRRITEVKFRIG